MYKAVTYLHSQEVPIIHRDLKPENILVDENFETKICDLSLSSFMRTKNTLRTTLGGTNGTRLYQAPEILLQNEKANTRTDIWSLGCIIYEILYQKMIWPNIEDEEDLKSLLKSANYLPNLSAVSKGEADIIRRCLNKDAMNRPKASEILQFYQIKSELV